MKENEAIKLVTGAVKDIGSKAGYLFKKNENVEKLSFKGKRGRIDLKKGFHAIGFWFTVHINFTRALILIIIFAILASLTGRTVPVATGADGSKVESFQVNKNSAIVELMNTYYNAYANADISTLTSITNELSDLEKGYISLMAGYVESYEDISCYVKSGLEDGTYFVCTSMSINFYGIEKNAPGVETFYIKTNEAGTLYIDNAYSTFNQQTLEFEMDPTVNERLTAFEQESDVVELCLKVSEEYAIAVGEDSSLNLLISSTLPTAIGNWMNSAVSEQAAAEEAQRQEQAAAEAAAAEEAAAAAAAAQAAEEAAAAEAAAEELKNQGYFVEGDVIYITSTVNIRESMSTEADRVGTAYAGDKVTVVMSYAEGWTKVKWGNKTGYIRTDVLLEQ